MIFYRLTDEQVRSATTSLMIGPIVVLFLALKIAEQGRVEFAVMFAGLMTILLSLIGMQIIQSRRLNATDQEVARG
ncbi:MAG: hypothetical protein ACRYFW_15285 [Janthinobacterium lividum]